MKPSFSLPNVYSDHMVFQRGAPITVTGSASPFQRVRVAFDDLAKSAVADGDGSWSVEFPPHEAGTGHIVRVDAPTGASIVLKDVAVGDVWIAGGQSNMEFPVVGPQFYGLEDGKKTAASADDPDLRILRVQRMVSPDGPCRDFPQGAKWLPATSPEAVGPCSAVGYLFAQYLRKRLGNVPVGIVSTNLGGCRIEPWIDEPTLRRHDSTDELQKIAAVRNPATSDSRAIARRIARIEEKARKGVEVWLKKKFFVSDPASTKAALASWAKPGIDLADWKKGDFSKFSALGVPGVVWYRREVEIPEGWGGKGLRFRAAAINDTDETFWDGEKIGETWVDTPTYWSAPREYAVPPRLARPGRHVLAIRVANHFASGSVSSPVVADALTGAEIDLLDGEWHERVELRPTPSCGIRPPVPGDAMTRDSYGVPATLFNAMFAPLRPLRFRGAIWYQGCSNADRAGDYASFQKWLVESWRKATRSPDMAFLQVQLAAFERHSPGSRLPDDWWAGAKPDDDLEWTEMREVQAKIRSLRLCDFVTAADIGDHSDIHPANKREVARRLDAAAGKMLYGATGVATGPSLAAVQREGAALRCSFTDVGAGLAVRPLDPAVRAIVEKSRAAAGKGKPSGRGVFFPEEHAFAVAGADGRWAWAGAKLDGDTVLVSSPDVHSPVAVRYAWAKYPPSMRLFNKDGFPAFPFRGRASLRKAPGKAAAR